MFPGTITSVSPPEALGQWRIKPEELEPVTGAFFTGLVGKKKIGQKTLHSLIVVECNCVDLL